MNLVMTLSWIAFVAAVVLVFVKLWHWRDIHEDWRAVKAHDPDSAIYLQGRGSMRLAWLRVVDGVLWLLLAALNLIVALQGLAPNDAPRIWGRGILIVMMGMELAKLLTDQLTRHQVMDANWKQRKQS